MIQRIANAGKVLFITCFIFNLFIMTQIFTTDLNKQPSASESSMSLSKDDTESKIHQSLIIGSVGSIGLLAWISCSIVNWSTKKITKSNQIS